ncbi:hypothetical protein L484_025947 [Morus notabilis]|uniref:Uncharacterized protein n=1 Tax=Morus notabilis TaxID=981085 RepID=W9RW74_9ROSA|nr:hypothetical protein L484_025947 [Morus notabilis]
MKKKKRNGGAEELRRRRSGDGGNTKKEEEERRRNLPGSAYSGLKRDQLAPILANFGLALFETRKRKKN